MRTLFLIVCVWTMSFVAVTFGSESKTSLTDVYCSFVLSEKNISNTDGITMGTFDERWSNFTMYLENREIFLKVTEDSDSKIEFDLCTQKNSEKFERGEFALSGLRSVLQTKALLVQVQPAVQAPTLIASNINLLDREISTPDMEVVYGFIPDEAYEEVPKDLLEDGLKLREEQYTRLWNEFLSLLKENHTLQQNGLSVLTKEVK